MKQVNANVGNKCWKGEVFIIYKIMVYIVAKLSPSQPAIPQLGAEIALLSQLWGTTIRHPTPYKICQDLSKYTVPTSFVGITIPTKALGMLVATVLPIMVVGINYNNIKVLRSIC